MCWGLSAILVSYFQRSLPIDTYEKVIIRNCRHRSPATIKNVVIARRI